MINSVVSWWSDLNDKVKHIIVCAVGSLAFGYGFGIGAGIAAEYKDKAWGGKWDWLDIAADIIGTAVGASMRYLIFGYI